MLKAVIVSSLAYAKSGDLSSLIDQLSDAGIFIIKVDSAHVMVWIFDLEPPTNVQSTINMIKDVPCFIININFLAFYCYIIAFCLTQYNTSFFPELAVDTDKSCHLIICNLLVSSIVSNHLNGYGTRFRLRILLFCTHNNFREIIPDVNHTLSKSMVTQYNNPRDLDTNSRAQLFQNST